MVMSNKHIPTLQSRQRVRDLVVAGIPKHLIAKIIKIDDETLTKHYEEELTCAQPEAVEAVSKTVYHQALNGNEKSQALYLKTQGAKFGWVEKQVIEQTDNNETEELKAKIADLEEKYKRDY